MTEVDPTWFESPLKIGTRRSKLALWQAHHIRDRLLERWGPQGLAIELVEIVTEGDRIQDRPLNEVGGKGLFVNGIEEQLLDGRVDLAVHSMKDLPSHLPEPLHLVATPEREDPRDALCGPAGARLAELPAGTRVGTSSLRRGALCKRINPGVEIVPLRGNVPTRLRKMEDGEADVILLAAAGLKRLGMADRIEELLEPDDFCPAAAQGILALECRREDARVNTIAGVLDHGPTRVLATAERAFLARLDGGCQVPMACFSELAGDEVRVRGLIIDPSGEPYFAFADRGPTADAARLGTHVAEQVLQLGGGDVLERLTPT